MDATTQAAKVAEMRDFGVTLANRKTPWELGMSWTEAGVPLETSQLATASEMLDAAGLANWRVAKIQARQANGDPIPGLFYNAAADGRIVSGTRGIGSTYKVFQNEDIFAFGDNIVDSGEAKWERGGGIKGGAIVFGCMELTHLGITVPGDDGEIKPYLLLVNTFDGSYPAQGVLAYVRPRCINTFQMAVGTQTQHRFAIRHVGSLDGKLQMAREALGIAFRHAQASSEVITRLALTSMVDEQVRELFSKVVWPISEQATDGQVERATSTLAFENYMTSETLDGIRGTAWGAFNGVTEFIDHETKYAGKGVSEANDVKATSLIWGAGELRKEAALKALVTLAK